MKLTRRRLCATLAGSSSLALVSRTDSFSAAGTGHTAEIETARSRAYLSFEGAALIEPVPEAEATLTLDSSLGAAELVRLAASAFVFDATPPLELPATVDVRLKDDRHGRVTDTVTATVKSPNVRAAAERELHVDGTETAEETPSMRTGYE
ncbi:hypothetical protein [Natronomonas sp. LN261]|uniref:hypothetical protein n=1 Tax=Natronomonas sp. LN261 TaxID=2750669 RepID=UPI0015EF7665|nr:hypothetical protein [Natronomonas sp. LN261]